MKIQNNSKTQIKLLNLTLTLITTLYLASCSNPYTPEPLPPKGTYIEPKLISTSNIQDSYKQGGVGIVELELSLDDPDTVINEAVYFLNIVEYNPETGDYPQAAEKIISFAELTNPIFQIVKNSDTLKETLTTTLKFKLKNDAPPGTYFLSLQLFRGRNTDPSQIKTEYRVGIKVYNFEIQKR